MNQEVVVSPKTLFEVLKGYNIFDHNSRNTEFFKHLQSDKLCLDKSDIILDALLDYIVSDGGPEVMQLWTGMVQHISQKYYAVDCKMSSMDSIDKCEGELAKNSTDNIWIKTNWETVRNTKLKSQFINLEYLSWDRYVNPSNQDFLIRDGRSFNLKAGSKFPFFDYLRGCIDGAKILIISDPYFVTSKQSILNLKQIIKMTSSQCKVTIRTFGDKERNRHRIKKDRYKVQDLYNNDLVSLKSEGQIKLIFQKRKNLHDRSIETDKWYIGLGGGLDRHDEDDNVIRETTVFFKQK